MKQGIDIEINELVDLFTSKLWTANNNSFYGRVFRNERFEDFGSKISPEVYVSASDPAKEVLKDYSYDAQCFFDVQPNETIENSDAHEATIWICFMVNLEKIYSSLTRTEATEQIQSDVEKLIFDSNFDITGLIRGFSGFSGYDWGTENSQAKIDMNPNYCFRFDTKLIYINC